MNERKRGVVADAIERRADSGAAGEVHDLGRELRVLAVEHVRGTEIAGQPSRAA